MCDDFQPILRQLSNQHKLVAAIGAAERQLAALEASIRQTAAIGEREAIQ